MHRRAGARPRKMPGCGAVGGDTRPRGRPEPPRAGPSYIPMDCFRGGRVGMIRTTPTKGGKGRFRFFFIRTVDYYPHKRGVPWWLKRSDSESLHTTTMSGFTMIEGGRLGQRPPAECPSRLLAPFYLPAFARVEIDKIRQSSWCQKKGRCASIMP